MFSFLRRIFGGTPETQVTAGSTAIKAALSDSRFTWRSIEALSKASGYTQEQTRIVLSSMRVNKSYGDKEVYTIHSHVGGYPFFYTPVSPSDASKQAILEALDSDQYTWSSIEALTKASGLSIEDTRATLRTLPVRSYITSSKELYALTSNVGE